MLKAGNIKTVLSPILAGMFILLSLSGCGLFPEEQEVLGPPLVEPEEVTYTTENVVTGYIENSITCLGTLVPAKSENLMFRYISDRLKKIYVVPGDKVKKGDLIAELLTDNVESNVRLQKQTMEMKKNDLGYSKKMSEIDIRQAKDKQKELEDRYRLMCDIPQSYSKKELEAALKEVNDQKVLINKLILGNDNQLKTKSYELEAAQARLADLNRQLDVSRLTAQVDGVITYISPAKEGDMVDAYSTIATIAEPSEMQLEYKGNDADKFILNGKVELEVDGNKLSGKVVLVPSSVPYEESEKYKDTVRIKPEKIPAGMEMGNSMQIKLVLESKENALILPKNAVHAYAGNYIVYVLEDGLREEKYIKKGIESSSMIEITEGLKPGEKVIVE